MSVVIITLIMWITFKIPNVSVTNYPRLEPIPCWKPRKSISVKIRSKRMVKEAGLCSCGVKKTIILPSPCTSILLFTPYAKTGHKRSIDTLLLINRT